MPVLTYLSCNYKEEVPIISLCPDKPRVGSAHRIILRLRYSAPLCAELIILETPVADIGVIIRESIFRPMILK